MILLCMFGVIKKQKPHAQYWNESKPIIPAVLVFTWDT